MKITRYLVLRSIIVVAGMVIAIAVRADLPEAGLANTGLPNTIARIRPSLVAVGTFQRTRNPQFKPLGTGFVVGDGSLIATNVHVVPVSLDVQQLETLAVAQLRGTTMNVREVSKLASDPKHDLAILKLSGTPLSALALGNADKVREGQTIAFSGFPMGDVFGLFPVTHRGIVSAIAPIGIPSAKASQLDAKFVRQLAAGPFEIFQLDATAYPGHSGSPMFDPDTGEVLGVVNMVFVKGARENVLSQPSGISYAIPVRHLHELLKSQ